MAAQFANQSTNNRNAFVLASKSVLSGVAVETVPRKNVDTKDTRAKLANYVDGEFVAPFLIAVKMPKAAYRSDEHLLQKIWDQAHENLQPVMPVRVTANPQGAYLTVRSREVE